MLDKVLRIGPLFDFYGALLTDKQRQCIEMHYLNDFSLSEIASEFNVSRQAVHDILRRAEQTLEEYEYKLQLVERCRREQQYIREVYSLLKGLPLQLKRNPDINQALIRLDDLIDWQKGV
ncbi:MAG: YlxM family DNA-binding protein [Veillonellaceae bacterium]|jgi:predicted DNA-binding protein YlxM (UPF0122 family)|nr:YlxM family DNA-binding protein [Veillonellaceae bacterium]